MKVSERERRGQAEFIDNRIKFLGDTRQEKINNYIEVERRKRLSHARIRQMIIEGVIVGAEKFGRDNVVAETEVDRLEETERKAGRPPKEKIVNK